MTIGKVNFVSTDSGINSDSYDWITTVKKYSGSFWMSLIFKSLLLHLEHINSEQ